MGRLGSSSSDELINHLKSLSASRFTFATFKHEHYQISRLRLGRPHRRRRRLLLLRKTQHQRRPRSTSRRCREETPTKRTHAGAGRLREQILSDTFWPQHTETTGCSYWRRRQSQPKQTGGRGRSGTSNTCPGRGGDKREIRSG